MKLTVDRRLADPLFVYYFVSSPESTRKIIQDSEATGVPKTNVTYLRDFPITLPPLLEQRAIAHILGTLDDKIELNRRMNETLEQMARALFKSWFVDFNPVRVKAEGRDPGLPGPLDDLFPARFEDSELGKIPAGWRVSSLGTLFPDDTECVLTGPFGSNLHAHDYREEGVPLILVKHVVDGHILEDDLPLVGAHKLGDMERYRLVVGDIVFTRVGAVGRSAYVHPRYSGWLISGQMLRVRVPDWTALHPRYLAQVFLEKSFTDMVEGYALGTNTRLRLQMMLRTR
jgi:type I restriction enzyme S subunit